MTGISNVPPQQGRVAISGQLAGVAPVRFDGTLGALGTEEPSNLKLTMKDMALPVLSPYFGRYLGGYSVDSGKLELALDYQITGTRLEASNEVILDRMQLGSAVASEQAINAPVKLGLALLTDRDGVIEVNLHSGGGHVRSGIQRWPDCHAGVRESVGESGRLTIQYAGLAGGDGGLQ